MSLQFVNSLFRETCPGGTSLAELAELENLLQQGEQVIQNAQQRGVLVLFFLHEFRVKRLPA